MEASGYDWAPFIPEFYDHVVPYATRQDVTFYVEAAREGMSRSLLNLRTE
jgi:hypothetical protein